MGSWLDPQTAKEDLLKIWSLSASARAMVIAALGRCNGTSSRKRDRPEGWGDKLEGTV
jgi:hypothetical protein